MTGKSLISDEYISDIADAIRSKTGSVGTMKVYDMADEIVSISGGGVELSTSLSTTSDKAKTSGAVTLTTELSSDEYTSVSGLNHYGHLNNATVSFYKMTGLTPNPQTDTLLGSVTTVNGFATYNTTITEDTHFYSVFGGNGESFNSANSNVINVEKTEYLYHPNLDGTDPITTICPERPFTSGNGICGGYSQQGYLSDGWDNTVDWKLTVTWQSSRWDGGMWLLNYPFTDCDHDHYNISNNKYSLILFDGYMKKCNGNGYSNTNILYSRPNTSTYVITKIGDTISMTQNGTDKGSQTLTGFSDYDTAYLGVNTWGGSGSVNTLSNIIVEEI